MNSYTFNLQPLEGLQWFVGFSPQSGGGATPFGPDLAAVVHELNWKDWEPRGHFGCDLKHNIMQNTFVGRLKFRAFVWTAISLKTLVHNPQTHLDCNTPGMWLASDELEVRGDGRSGSNVGRIVSKAASGRAACTHPFGDLVFPVCIEDDFLLFSFVFLLLWGICLHCFRWVCQYDGGFKHSVIPPTHSHCKGMIWAPTDSTVANVEDFPLHPSNTAIHSWSLCLCFWQHCGTLMGREAGARPFLPRWYSDFATGLTGCYTGGQNIMVIIQNRPTVVYEPCGSTADCAAFLNTTHNCCIQSGLIPTVPSQISVIKQAKLSYLR